MTVGLITYQDNARRETFAKVNTTQRLFKRLPKKKNKKMKGGGK